MSRRLLVAAGGTGGHIFPGIAVAEKLKQLGWEVSWVGTEDRMESQVVPNHGIYIDYIKVKGLRGNGIKRLIKAPFMIVKAIFAARKIIKIQKPDAVLAMGGYVTGPVGIAAKMLGVPLIIHEQNAVAGFSNKLLAKLATRVLCAFSGAFKDKQYDVVGNPIRESVSQIHAKPIGQKINCLVVGGSLGARALNEAMPSVFSSLGNSANTSLSVWHQSGKGNGQLVSGRYEQSAFTYKVTEFIENMDQAYEWADIIICRAGALTVSEVAAAGKMAVFVPLPHAVDDHQTLNARALVDKNAALLMPQSELNEHSMANLLKPYFEQPHLVEEKAKRAKACAQLNATNSVVEIIKQVTN
ncbi:undecaprenyldiphospho-muramoylpentapeptide beta-N-acetylglucosaminyltransferase [Pseudoalteromonas luteoviolacea]|uniref:UDP-N-acetylglucosamine--N-acetylmuramyl-(pentapeptide) pyrophosphoryl-undecaprenol N-acetylglucosamine transferase n=1 Tax=Pseudoalteromonas luteoviolacea S4054 TaxID=1129367 RepID=A0A0F6AF46_9GAMM|nr:undecaprenyldiphospho-muramoylpentapeptide beta-N-acetylglucosaminyltransferase [Pseudoalteromonas luteoviolacea]AOT09741.1 UDP-N-acetylglucosamine--N-acetylmuramyl-(pentapeptide) pyrophosphoryl-undecaprenol N-acetylglucosamine transferase [Pseudoalteromonas luteoviolacea]AOT14654.1 UDP-N-acetylglucosamine--N-acetylmuramyl-(pentapeptide) pyrophosphoryl-undecaprenol N-acetylglucosamine transferase [Pseudoalteromonas luteoviolacea]AOT19568.1 UDP-N-acetylglucosamine--N-acetylmuramyl-(pentapeptid